ncbi:MAG: hypothetical protein VYB54_14760 [Pseudomonadota bacterium]|nr:hypothetical protein [Pseudomonadota bacterium]
MTERHETTPIPNDERTGRVWSKPTLKELCIELDTMGGTIGPNDGTNVGSAV